jgi:hypothetical protein
MAIEAPDEEQEPVDESQVDPAELAEQQNAEPVTNPDDDAAAKERTKARIAELEKKIEFPDYVKTWVDRFDDYRAFVGEDALLLDDEDTVSTNFVFRNMCVQIANLYATDPDASFSAPERLGPPDEMLQTFGETVTLFVKQCLEDVRFKRRAWAALASTYTVGISWVKITPQEDFKRDPVGTCRQDDQQDNIATYRHLQERFAAQEFDENSAEYHRMEDLQQTVAEYMKAELHEDLASNPPMQPQQVPDPLTGLPTVQPVPQDPRETRLQQLESGQMDVAWLPEPTRFIGFNIDQVAPEDLRWDWNITNLVDIYQARWIAHRVWMTSEEIGSKWGVPVEELKMLNRYDSKGEKVTPGKSMDDPATNKDLEATTKNDRCAVWEYHDKTTGRVLVWACGMERFLDDYVPDATWRNWYPFFPLGFNLVDGRLLPISDVQLQMHLQDEVNRLRTFAAEARKACFPRFAIKKGSMTPQEKKDFEDAAPFQVVELNAPQDVKDALMTLGGTNYHAELYDTTSAVHDMEVMSGISQVSVGAVTRDDSHFATDTAVAAQQFGVQTDYRRTILESWINDICTALADMGVAIVPEENIKARVGQEAFWPLVGRAELLQMLRLNVRSGSTGRPDREEEVKFWEMFPDLMMKLGLVPNGVYVAQQMFKAMGKNIDMNKAVMAMVPPGMPPAEPGPQGGARPGAGAPPMSQSGPPAPNKMPGPGGRGLKI